MQFIENYVNSHQKHGKYLNIKIYQEIFCVVKDKVGTEKSH